MDGWMETLDYMDIPSKHLLNERPLFPALKVLVGGCGFSLDLPTSYSYIDSSWARTVGDSCIHIYIYIPNLQRYLDAYLFMYVPPDRSLLLTWVLIILPYPSPSARLSKSRVRAAHLCRPPSFRSIRVSRIAIGRGPDM